MYDTHEAKKHGCIPTWEPFSNEETGGECESHNWWVGVRYVMEADKK